ncbi:MAG: peptide deformylase [bacterium]
MAWRLCNGQLKKDVKGSIQMSILDIKTYPDPVLSKKCSELTDINKDIDNLINQMVRIMYNAQGVGLAASQVGILKSLAVIDTSCGKKRGDLIVLVNPHITHSEGEEFADEGCLSIPDYRGDVKRAAIVNVRYTDRKGNPREIEARELLARALQHEIDHLQGILFIDRLGKIKRELVKKRLLKKLSKGR